MMRARSRGRKRLRYGICFVILLLLFGLFACAAVSDLTSADFSITTPFFSGKRVMVIIPHQDDEINLAGGIMEQYVRSGSEVTLVYSTNGDYNGLAEQRSREALAVAESIGIPARNVYYLGYGDQWEHQEQDGTIRKHIYFSADGDALWTSHFGATKTYGTSLIDCYSDSDYTRNNFRNDLMDLILEKRPDIIYCVDYDAHHDHMALDLFFEEVMGIILAQEEDYFPVVYKGFCYGTAWYAPQDYIGAENLASSKFPTWEHWDRLGISYRWEDRVRLPVSAGNLGRLLSQTELYQSLRLFRSQNGHRFAESVLNGDKVFWERRTDSLLYRASFFADGEQVFVWNDFKLKDSTDFSALVNTGVGYAQQITVTLEAPVPMDAVWLYDDPSAEDNILAGYLRFDDGSRVDFGPLEPGGSATCVSFPRRSVGSFEICFTQTEGDAPGVTEIEAYCGDQEGSAGPMLLMAVDEQDDLVYDYWIPSGDHAELSLYAYPGGSVSGWEDVTVSMEGDRGCSYTLENGTLRVVCPRGQEATFTISCSDEVSTTFAVSNPGAFTRRLTLLLQELDHRYALFRDDQFASNS